MATPSMLTPAHYTNWMPFVFKTTPEGFAIECRPTPKVAIALMSLFIASFFIAMAIFLWPRKQTVSWLVIGFGSLTTIGTAALLVLYHEYQQRRGPVLIYTATPQSFNLHRQGRTVAAQEVECICIVTGQMGEGSASQLQLHTRSGQHFLLVTAYRKKELLPILKSIASVVSAPMRLYQEPSKKGQEWTSEAFVGVG